MAVAIVAVVVLVLIALVAALALIGANAWFNTSPGNPPAATDAPAPTSEPLITVPAPGSMLVPPNSPYASGAS
jgi:hypothetical protein